MYSFHLIFLSELLEDVLQQNEWVNQERGGHMFQKKNSVDQGKEKGSLRVIVM